MAGNTKIEWATDSDNFQAGCTKARNPDGTVAAECVHCYAESWSANLARMAATRGAPSRYQGVVTDGGRWTGVINAETDKLQRIFSGLRNARRTRSPLFLGSMTDNFHEDTPAEVLDVYAEELAHLDDRIAANKCPPHWIAQLTKRPGVLLEWQRKHFPLGTPRCFAPGVTCGHSSSVWRVRELAQVLALGPRMVSAEPLLGAIADDLQPYMHRIGWIVAGGESGPNARPMHPDWARGLRDQCEIASVPFFFKQWGEWSDVGDAHDLAERGYRRQGNERVVNLAGGHGFHGTDPRVMARVGKRRAGRLLDGRTHDEFPEVTS